MHRYWFVLLLSVLMTSISRNPKAEAQESQPAQEKSLSQKIEARNSIAKFTVSLSPINASVGQEVVLSIRVSIEKGWHIGATDNASIGFPTQIHFAPVGLEPIDLEFSSSTKPQKQELGVGTQWLMEGEFEWMRKYRVIADDSQYRGTGTIRFQACDDQKCLPPQTVEFALGESHPDKASSASQEPMTQNTSVEGIDAEKTVGAPIVLDMQPCELTRIRPQLGNPLALIFFGLPTDKMVWKATIPSGPEAGVAIYLPKAKQYSLQNTGSDGTKFSNTATYVSVDQNKDGTLADWEAAAANRPIRIHDSMYRVTDINTESKTMTLQQLDAPLKGSVIGFRCPDFEFTALDGSIISNKSILGKTTVLDIWAVTCHNCYEGFPKIQNALDKHSAEKLSVVLLTVDTDRKFYDSLAPNLFQTYGGASWPQVMIPGGFEGALILGDYGFGSVVVDETGIVRAVGALGFNIESIIDDVIKNTPHKEPSENAARLR